MGVGLSRPMICTCALHIQINLPFLNMCLLFISWQDNRLRLSVLKSDHTSLVHASYKSAGGHRSPRTGQPMGSHSTAPRPRDVCNSQLIQTIERVRTLLAFLESPNFEDHCVLVCLTSDAVHYAVNPSWAMRDLLVRSAGTLSHLPR